MNILMHKLIMNLIIICSSLIISAMDDQRLQLLQQAVTKGDVLFFQELLNHGTWEINAIQTILDRESHKHQTCIMKSIDRLPDAFTLFSICAAVSMRGLYTYPMVHKPYNPEEELSRPFLSIPLVISGIYIVLQFKNIYLYQRQSNIIYSMQEIIQKKLIEPNRERWLNIR